MAADHEAVYDKLVFDVICQKTKVSASLRVPNTEIQMKARGRRCLEPVMKHEPPFFLTGLLKRNNKNESI